MKLKIELIQDNGMNALLYKSQCITSCVAFKSLIDMLYDLKAKNIAYAKPLLSCLWGSLCEKNKKYKLCTSDFNIPDGYILTGARPTKEGHDIMEYTKVGNYYKHNFARLAPFLLSAVRRKMATTVYPIRDKVYRMHTDSLVTTVKLQNIKDVVIDEKIGNWKIEKQGDVIIKKNGRKPEWKN